MRESHEPELVLLNGHLLIERMLVAIAGVRLKCDQTEVPRFGFRHLVQLAFRRGDDSRHVNWLNELRNALAHQFDALESRKFEELVQCFDFDWPSGARDRAVVIQLIVHEVEHCLLRRMIDEIEHDALPFFDGEWNEELHTLLRSHADTSARTLAVARRLIRLNAWDKITEVFRPLSGPTRGQNEPC
jgi:hypothetical protein